MRHAQLGAWQGHSVYVAPLSSTEKAPGKAGGQGLGQYLLGTATLPKEEGGKRASVVEFKYILLEQPAKKKGGNDRRNGHKKKGEDAAANLEEALRDCKISFLPKINHKSKQGEALYRELCQSNL